MAKGFGNAFKQAGLYYTSTTISDEEPDDDAMTLGGRIVLL